MFSFYSLKNIVFLYGGSKEKIVEAAFLCEICKIFKNIFFTEHLRVAASEIRKK